MSENRYLEDESVESPYRDSSPISAQAILTGSAIIAGSALAYRSGALSSAISDIAKSVSKRKPVLSVASNDLRKWFESDGYDDVKKSVFRLGVKDSVKEFIKMDKANAKEVVDQSKADIQRYLRRFDRTLDELMTNQGERLIKNTVKNTEILDEAKWANKAVEAYSDRVGNAKYTLQSKVYDTLIKNRIQTKEQAQNSLKRSGLRRATLDDFVSARVDSQGKLRLYEKTNFSFSSKVTNEERNGIEELERILNTYKRTDGGTIVSDGKKNVRLFEANENFKSMVIDNNLFINKKGEFIDLRDQKTQWNDFVKHMATEWQIPGININPLRMAGIDKLGKRKVNFATIKEDVLAPAITGKYGMDKSNTIAGAKGSVEKLKGVKEGVTIINGDVYKFSEDGLGITKIDYKTKKKVIAIPKELDKGNRGLTIAENAQRKMFGLNRIKTNDYKQEDGKFKYYRQKLAKFFDIGRQEGVTVREKLSGLDLSNPDAYIESTIKKTTGGINKAENRIKTVSGLTDFNDRPKDSFFVTNESISLKDVAANKFNLGTVRDYFAQYTTSFKNNPELVNAKTAWPFFMVERMNQALGKVGLGLSVDNTQSAFGTYGQLLLKRFLPVYGAYKAWDWINNFGEDHTDNGKKPGNLQQHIAQGIANIDIGVHNLTDKLGISKISKRIGNITPGSDMLAELPGLNALNLDKTGEERAEYWKYGYDKVRKGRYWSLNNTPFVGGKIQYWKPNMLRSSLADAKYSDSLYGSRKERYSHILNPRYYDVRNYNIRPYLMTSPAFENVPVVGPLLSGTIGKVIAPQRRMHEEYWNEDGPKSLAQIQQEKINAIMNSTEYSNQERIGSNSNIAYNIGQNHEQNLTYISQLKDLANRSSEAMVPSFLRDSATIEKIYNLSQNSKISANNSLQNVRYSDNTFATNMANNLANESSMKQMFKTGSGASRVIELTGKNALFNKHKINKKGYTLGQITDVKENATALGPEIVSKDAINNAKMANPENPNSFSNTLANQYVDSANVAGIYGFAFSSFVTGNPGAGKTVIETSGYHRSFNKAFWDQDLGGLSGEVSEIFRRFVQKRRSDQNYYNPIRNRMADWLPGEGVFIDFQHGDPYSKIARGEERLPGEGYERLHEMNMNQMLEMKTGSSTIGKTKDEIINHLLHRDEISDPEALSIVNTGTRMHEQIEKQLMKNGIGIDNEVEIKDEKNGIIGYYDIKVHDKSSLTGEAIVDIKTVGAKKLEKIRKNKAPLDEHQRQVNWYLHHTNPLNKGYIYYVNRDDPNDTYTLGFNYSHKMYKSTMDTLQAARSEIGDMLQNGQISRGDLYKPIDKYRVLADVAPYSDEYKEMNKLMSGMQLTDKEQDEVRRIRDRVAEQQQPKRFYAYKFKNAGVLNESGTIGRQINPLTYNIKGSDNPIKLAGVEMRATDPKYEEAMNFLDKHMGEGKRISILVAQDETQRHNGDALKTVKATVYSDGMNINRELIKRGYAQEKEDDFSAAGVHARFNSLERGVGKAWESVAHLDTLVNTKLLQVRTAKEDYERTQVYGKEFKDWKNPVQDFLMPAIWTNMNRSAALGIGIGAVIGTMAGRTAYGRFMLGTAGALTVAGAKAYKAGYEAKTGERWIPKEKREQRDLDDYIDKLKFVKNRRLFEVYAEKSLREDGFDVKEFLEENKRKGDIKKAKARKIQKVKNEYTKTGKFKTKDFEEAGVKFNFVDKLAAPIRSIITGEGRDKYKEAYDRIMDFGVNERLQAENAYKKKTGPIWKKFGAYIREAMGEGPEPPKKSEIHWDRMKPRGSIKKQWNKIVDTISDAIGGSQKKKQRALERTVNKSINDLKDSRVAFNMPENAMKAVEFYNASEQTMYGYDPGEPLTNIMAAMPKRDKQYFREFLKAPKEDRAEILSMAPKYMRRALQSAYGMEVDKKEDLTEYFNEHYLPGEEWDGWQENMDLEAMKTKIIQTQGGNLAEHNKWEDDKIKADLYGKMDIPNINYRTRNTQVVRDKLETILGQAGYSDLDFSFQFGKLKSSIDLKMYDDRKAEYDSKLRERLGL